MHDFKTMVRKGFHIKYQASIFEITAFSMKAPIFYLTSKWPDETRWSKKSSIIKPKALALVPLTQIIIIPSYPYLSQL